MIIALHADFHLSTGERKAIRLLILMKPDGLRGTKRENQRNRITTAPHNSIFSQCYSYVKLVNGIIRTKSRSRIISLHKLFFFCVPGAWSLDWTTGLLIK